MDVAEHAKSRAHAHRSMQSHARTRTGACKVTRARAQEHAKPRAHADRSMQSHARTRANTLTQTRTLARRPIEELRIIELLCECATVSYRAFVWVCYCSFCESVLLYGPAGPHEQAWTDCYPKTHLYTD